MKAYKIVMILGLAGLTLSSCSEDETPSQKEKQLKKLSDTWVVTSVTMDGGDVTSDYSSFELTLSGSAGSSVFAYGVIGRPEVSPWPSGGTWTFGSAIFSQLIRDPDTDDELDIAYAVTNTTLEIDFHFSGEGYQTGKVKSAEGHWEYTFMRK